MNERYHKGVVCKPKGTEWRLMKRLEKDLGGLWKFGHMVWKPIITGTMTIFYPQN